ncbi:MAG: TIGR03663 family protein [Candidatus Promineofilum sp.]|nr:TIGR03663 family protein [Promineifilum sp.]
MTDLSTLPSLPPAKETAATDFLSRPLIAALSIDWEKAIYLTFMILAILTRFYGLGDRVVSHDESLHTQYSYQFYNGDGYVHSPLMHGPTLFHATALSYWLFGDSDFASRVPDAILGVLLVLLPYFLRDWLGRRGALFASFMLLISPYVSYYSRYIRHDVYLIVFALIVFIATWYYIRERRNKYLWWFTVGLVLMFATMEASFIYVAIFGSFMVLRLLALVVGSSWLGDVLPRLRIPLLVALLGVVLVGAGYGAHKFMADDAADAATATATSEGFAADPNATQTAIAPAGDSTDALTRWIEIIGIVAFGLGLFLIVRQMRPHIDGYPEFDIIMLYVTLVLPLASPLLVRVAGWDPDDYTINKCVLAGQETMSGVTLFVDRITNTTCVTQFLNSPATRSALFLFATLIISVLVGLWWDRRRWPALALAYTAIFLFFFTSIFTNLAGWRTGAIGSLGYWLKQQGVQRGSQPGYFYFFVTTFYEFLPILFSLAGIHLWTKQRRINGVVWYWVLAGLVAALGYSLTNYFFNRGLGDPLAQSRVPGLIAAAAVLLIATGYWFLVRRRQIVDRLGLERGLRDLIDLPSFVGFVPSIIWWMLLAWTAYSLAGEKMPWLSIHITIPMILLAGWYLGRRVESVDARELFSRRGLAAVGLTVLLILMAAVALGPLLLGQIRLGRQEVDLLENVGRFLGGLLVAGGVAYLWLRLTRPLDRPLRGVVTTLAIFAVLAGLTIRFSYMANYINYDYTNEFMVYAHGAPATKSVVLDQLEELSMRLYGDKSIKVAFDSDVSWPFTWYLREYPNRVYFGDNASQSLNESPVVIVGSKNWGNVDPFLANNYTNREYTFLWWPMEDYRRFSWNALFGNPADESPRGLGNPDVRQALWDIFFHRDYTKYGEVFGGTFTAGEWPLRHDLRLYIRKDVLADLWDYGVGAVSAAPLVDPYEAGALAPSPTVILNAAGVAGTGEGTLSGPRNVAVGPDGLIYVADSGNSRIQVFDGDGQFQRGWGSFGAEPGQFNEPWSLAVDDEYVYVADTWNHRIQKFTLNGELVGVFGQSGSPAADDPSGGLGVFFGPRDIVLIGDTELLVTDTGNHRLQLLDRDGNFLRNIGSFGNELGQFNEPVGLAVGPDGVVYVADTWNGRIQRLTPELVAVGEWRVEAWAGQSINNKPYLATDSAGRVYTTDPEGYRVLIFSPAGAYLGRFGQYGTDTGSLGLPNGLAVAADDSLWVADSGNHRVLGYAPLFGGAAAEPLLVEPTAAPPGGDEAYPAGVNPEPTIADGE